MKKIKTDHPFTKLQLKSLNKELEKISNIEIVSLKGPSLPGKDHFTDIRILHSPFSLDVFLSFINIMDPDHPKAEIYKIDPKGIVDYKPRSSMNFNSLADRVSFFTELNSINFK